MIIQDSVLQNGEKISFALRELYLRHQYRPYRMSKFEEYDLYAHNKDFLLSDNVITFTDIGGKLMALKPDVTLSIIKNSKDLPDKTQKVFYNENIYRVAKGTDSFKEIMQTGVECFGRVGEQEVYEVVLLAAESLAVLSEEYVLAVSDLDILKHLISTLSTDPERQERLYRAVGEKNVHEMQALCDEGASARVLQELVLSHLPVTEALKRWDDLLAECRTEEAYERFRSLLLRLAASDAAAHIFVDFSVTDNVHYYNGLVFKGFLRHVQGAVVSGGQYDRLMRKMQRNSRAIGFAVYTDGLDRMYTADRAEEEDDFLHVALPKGRLGEKVYALFAQAGWECPSLLEPNRKLIFENTEKRVRYFWVKPSDVAIYVERGAADIGVAGKDILLEYEPDVYELLDLCTGKCRMAVAAPKGFADNGSSTLRVATKFSRMARRFYQSQGRDIDIIHLNGSIELAPILGLSDVIFDIVETGATLRENNLEVVETVVPISARLIANKSSLKFKQHKIEEVRTRLAALLEESV